MSLDVAAALENGFSRIPTRVAGLLFVAYLAIGIVSSVAAETLRVAAMDAQQPDAALTPTTPGVGGSGVLALDVGLPVAAVLFLVQLVVAQVVGVVAIRTFVSDARRTFPTGVSRHLPWVVLNAIIASVVVNVFIGLGTLLLVIPGIYLAVGLYFVQFEVIAAEENAIEALRTGWDLTKGERLAIFLLLLVILAIGIASAVPSLVLGFVGAPPLLTGLVGIVLGAVANVFTVAIGSRAYVQLKPDGWSPDFVTSDPFSY